MRYLTFLMAGLLCMTCAQGEQNGPKLNLVIVQGDGAINNIRQRTAREPVVQVEDENHKPVAGATVVFLLPTRGAGGTFANGSHTLTVVTDDQGRAVARGLQANRAQGQFQIHVNASYRGQTANTVIAQTNVAAAGAGAAAAAGISAKLIVIIAAAAAAGTVGGLYASHTIGGGGGNTSATIPSGLTITPGSGSVGPPR